MKKVIEEYYCDYCGKKVGNKGELIYHEDSFLIDNSAIFYNSGYFCKECHKKYKNNVLDILGILSRSYGNVYKARLQEVIKGKEEEEDDLV